MNLESQLVPSAAPFVVVLGVAQDAGVPQPGCECRQCRDAWDDLRLRRHPACLGIVDPLDQKFWMLDCTPSFGWQLRQLREAAGCSPAQLVSGIFVTHAHLGHYTGLAWLGREAVAAQAVSVYAMPRMTGVLRDNEPWRQLVNNKHIALKPLDAGQPVALNDRIRVTPFLVPHRDELSETIGLEIAGPSRSVGWLTDIDAWDDWDVNMEDWIGRHDVVFVDGTFFDDSELPGRARSQIPHPTIRDTVDRLSASNPALKPRVNFVHLNHTNSALCPQSPQSQWLADSGCRVAEEGQRELL